MPSGKFSLFIFRAALFLIVVIAVEVIGYTAMWLNSRDADFLSNKNYFRIRDMLVGNTQPEHLPRYVSLPYLGYIPCPGYTKNGILQHNQHGYRGRLIPLQKGNKFRVLCLGGSTTYGFGVDSPAQAFPAQLEILLNNSILNDSTLSARYAGAEVLNAGLEAGTSAEELQQYIFKYSYYRPHAVIVCSGINDAQVAAQHSNTFQLDYTHYRRLNFNLPPLPTPARWLMRSWFFSYVTIRLFYHQFSDGQDVFAHQGELTYPLWSSVNIDSVVQLGHYTNYPFYNNTRTLYERVLADSAMLFTLPNVLNPNAVLVKQNQSYKALSELNISLSNKLAEQMGGRVLPFAFDSIKNPACWLDDCHLNAQGEANKAQVVVPAILNAMRAQTMRGQ